MLYREIIAVCSQIHTKHINTLCGQYAEFCNVKPGGTYCSNHWALEGKVSLMDFCFQDYGFENEIGSKVGQRISSRQKMKMEY